MNISLSREDLARLYVNLFGEDAPESYMMGVRGAVPVESGGSELRLTSNEVGLNTDTLGLVTPNGVRFYQGTLDPGDTEAIRRNYRVRGAFHIGDGLHDTRKGDHCPPSGCYEAFRIRNARGWRDRGDVNGVQDASDIREVVVPDHINIHRGAAGLTIGPESEGCCNVMRGPWPTFKRRAYDELPNNFTFWVMGGLRLRDSLHSKIPIFLSVNGTPLGNDLPVWLSSLQSGKTMVAVRPLITRLALQGNPIGFRYEPDPPRLIFPTLGGAILPVTLVDRQGVAGLRDVISLLDDAAEFAVDLESRRIDIQSARLSARLVAPIPVAAIQRVTDTGLEVDFA